MQMNEHVSPENCALLRQGDGKEKLNLQHSGQNWQRLAYSDDGLDCSSLFHFSIPLFHDGVIVPQQTMATIEFHSQRLPKGAIFFAERWVDAAFQTIHRKIETFSPAYQRESGI